MKNKIWIPGVLTLLSGLLLILGLRFERWGQPGYFLLLLGLVPLVALWHYGQRRYQQRLARLSSPELQLRMQFKANPRWGRRFFLTLAIFVCLVMALARPQGPPTLTQTRGQGINLLIALDLSDSMKAQDQRPNRLRAAQKAIYTLLQQLPGDRVGLVVFSGEAFAISPFTHDVAALSLLLNEIQFGMLPSRTTDLEELLQFAHERFEKSRQKSDTGQVLVIFSDGENQLGNYQNDIARLSKAGVRIFTVGTGSSQGAPIPEIDPQYGTRSFKSWRGQQVISQLDEKALKNIANQGQGNYLHLDRVHQLPQLLQQARSQLKVSSFTTTGIESYEERFPLWLLLAFCLLLLELSWPRQPLWPEVRNQQFQRLLQKWLKAPQQVSLLVLSCLLMGAWSWPWSNFWQNWKGQEAYEQKDFSQAERAFSQGLKNQPQQPALENNRGSAYYRAQKYAEASEDFRKNTQNPLASPEQKAQSWYNLGNSLYRQGANSQNKEMLEQAVEAYQQALQLNPRDTQAQENLKFVQQLLEQQSPPQQNQGSQNSQNQSGQDTPQPPRPQPDPQIDNLITNEAMEEQLESVRELEANNQQYFQRIPQDQRQDPLQRDPDFKDW